MSLQGISNDPYLYIIMCIVGIVSLALAIYGIWGQRRRQLGFSYNTNLLINDNVSAIEGLAISYEGKEIKTLSVTNIKLLNCGNSILEKNDIYKASLNLKSIL